MDLPGRNKHESRVMASAMNVVKGEIHNVLSMMRVNARWASSDRFHHEIPAATQSPLLRAFQQLHYELQGVNDLSDVDAVTYLLPFIMVIESEATSGFITGAALSSLHKFLLYSLFSADSLRADVAINRLATSVARCRFEETHRDDDEDVLLKLLELAEFAVRCDAGAALTGVNVWAIIQLCYRVRNQSRASIHLRRAAENALAHITLSVFDRLEELEEGTKEDESSPDVESSTSLSRTVPYGIFLLERMLEFLVKLISPADNDDSTRVLGLRLINIVLETSGTGLGSHPRLVTVLQGDLSKFLLQNSETEDLSVLSLTLRVVFNLFNSIKDHLKVQLEVFFTSVHLRLIDSPSCTPEQKELALESLLEFCREPALMLDLYINYDCDVHCTNLFEVLCKSLARNCQAMESEDGSLNALTNLCLESLLAVIESIARRCPLSTSFSSELTEQTASSSDVSLQDMPPLSSVHDLMQRVLSSASDSESEQDDSADQLAMLHTARERAAEVLQQRKRAKKRYALAADKFNSDQKHWMAFAQQLGLLPEQPSAEDVASFLLHTPGLDKTLVGDYIGDGPEDKLPFNCAVRDAYVSMFDFSQCTSLDEALREFLARFRLPGEAQKIDRLMEAFSKHFFSQCQDSGPFKDADAAFVLAFSIILLNTDLHSSQIAKKMTLEEFIRNNRGINGGEDLPKDYLEQLYDNIANKEIQMQPDAPNVDSSSAVDRYSIQWEGVLKRSENVVGASFSSNASILKLRAGLYEKDMFSLVADATLTSVLDALSKTRDAANMQRALDGLRDFAVIALYYGMQDRFQRVMAALTTHFATFAHQVLQGEVTYVPPKQRATTSVVRKDSLIGQNEMERDPVESPMLTPSFMEDDLEKAAMTRRALLCLKLIFEFVQTRSGHLAGAWPSVVDCMLLLNELETLPESITEREDFVDDKGVPLPPAQTKRMRQQPLSPSSSLWTSLSSYLWSEEDAAEEQALRVQQTIKEHVTALGGGILEKENWLKMVRRLPDHSLVSLVETLLPMQRVDKTDDAIVMAELAVDAILANSSRMLSLELWAPFHSFASTALSTPMEEALAERVVVHILRSSIRLFHDDQLRTRLMETMELLATLDDALYLALGQRLASGLLSTLRANLAYMSTFHDWDVLLGILENLVANNQAINVCFEAAELLVDGHVTSNNMKLWKAFVLRFTDTSYAASALALVQRVVNSSELKGEEWILMLRVMLAYVDDGRSEVAKEAWRGVYESLVVNTVPIDASEWQKCFEQVVFALDEKEAGWEVALNSVTLLSKTFLHHLSELLPLPNFREIWLEVVRRLVVKLNVRDVEELGDGEAVVVETAQQALYNLLLVLRNEHVLERVSNFDTGATLLDETSQVIDQVSPHFKQLLGMPETTSADQEEESNGFEEVKNYEQELEAKRRASEVDVSQGAEPSASVFQDEITEAV